MTNLPKLPEAIQRKLDLLWGELTVSHGFNDEPIRLPDARRANGEWRTGHLLVNYEQAVGDDLIRRTISLAEKRFDQIAGEYLAIWAIAEDARTDIFAEWLGEIKAVFVSQLAGLWSNCEWAPAFQRRTLAMVDERLMSLIISWKSRARKLEIQHLENPHRSLESLLMADGNMNVAATLGEGKRTIESAQRFLSSLNTADPSIATKENPAGRLSPVSAIRPGEPLSENFPPDDPRHKALAPFFEVMEKFQVLAAEHPTLSIDWWAENAKWMSWPPPGRAIAGGERYPRSPGSDLHIKTSAEEAGRRLLESPESWFDPGRDPWLDVTDKEPWECWFYAIREFWLNAKDETADETEDTVTDMDELGKVAEEVGYRPTHSPQAIGERVWRKMVKSKKSLQELGLAGGGIGEYEEPAGWLQRGRIKHAFRACAYFCGVLAARRAREFENVAVGDPAPIVKSDTARPTTPGASDGGYKRHWYLGSQTLDRLEARTDAFERLVRQTMAGLKSRFSHPSAAVDAWLDILQKESPYTFDWQINPLYIASAEYCEELKTRSYEANDRVSGAFFDDCERRFRQLLHSGADLYAFHRGIPDDQPEQPQQSTNPVTPPVADSHEPVLEALQPAHAPEGSVTSPPPQRKRGRPAKIPDERKRRALAAKGGKARAQILYATQYPTPQQVKNVPSILRHYRGKSTPKKG